MNDLQPPRLILRTTPEILKQTTTIIFSTRNNLLTCLLLSLYLLSLRGNVEMSTHFLTSFIDNDPSMKSLFDRVNAPPNSTSPTSTITTRRVGIVDDDSSPQDDEFGHRLPEHQSNSTSFMLESFDQQLGVSNFVSDNAVRASETARSTAKKTSEFIDDSAESQTYFQSLLKRFDLGHHEYTALIFFTLAFAASCWIIFYAFIDINPKVPGVIFVLVLNDLCKLPNSFHATFRKGSLLGLNRFSGVNALRMAVRGVFIHSLNFWFFKGIDDSSFLLKNSVRSMFMPFSIMAPWDWEKGFDKEINSFVLTCFLLDMLVSFVFAMVGWIVMADPRMKVKDVVKEGFHLLTLMIKPAIELKLYECIACGTFARWVLSRILGNLFALGFQCFMEVYFMVAWMVYYLSAKSIDANLRGQPFGQRELEAILRDVNVRRQLFGQRELEAMLRELEVLVDK